MSDIARICISACLAAMAPALPFFVISLLAAGNPPVLIAAVVLAVSSAHVFILGIPAFLVLKWKRIANRWSLLIAGFALGSIPSLLFSFSNIFHGGSLNLPGTFLFGLIGAFSGWVFWVSWCRLGPN